MLKLSFNRRVPPHICETEEIAELVKSDIEARSGGTPKIIDFPEILLDCGGVFLIGVEASSVPGADHVCFFPQHYSLVRLAVRKATLRADAYYKIHLQFAHCLSPQTFQLLSTYLVNNEGMLLQREAAAIESASERFAEIASHPNIEINQCKP